MRIERIDVVPYALPFREPYVTARGRLERRALVLVRLHAEGLVGLGETAALSLRGGDPLASIVRELESIRPGPDGCLQQPTSLSRPARAALEIALLDLRAKLAGEPAWRTLGAEAARPLTCNATLTAGTPGEVTRQARAWAERGFETFKLKAGMDGDVAQVAAARRALPSGATLRVDANGAWSVAQAAERLDAMGRLELAEQPVATSAELHELRALTDVPLAADESVVTVEDARAAAGACRFATVKLAKVGGPGAALEISNEIPVYLSSALEGPVGITAAAHVAQALPDAGIAHGLATGVLFSESIGKGADLDGQLLRVPDGPGLGVELDTNSLGRLALERAGR
jgi:L-alanine-DL-glutamate epimerase-like enolase superfamily enzyme